MTFLARTVLRPLLLVAALAWVPFAFLAAVPLNFWWVFPSLLAFLPYAVVFTLLVATICRLLRARVLMVIALIGVVVLVAPRLGRFTGNAQPHARGERIVIATSNVRFGSAHPAALMRLVRTQHVDVLALQEDTPDLTDDLRAAGLRTLFPYGAVQDAPGARGISVYSRYPLDYVPRKRGDKRSVGGIIHFPGGKSLQIRTAHPPPPYNQSQLHRWTDTTRALTATIRSVDVPTILTGDFNASLDEHPLRHVLAANHLRDAADQTGNAWRPTWTNGTWATLTLDHILVPAHIAIERVTIHDLPGSDHDVVVATLRLPA